MGKRWNLPAAGLLGACLLLAGSGWAAENEPVAPSMAARVQRLVGQLDDESRQQRDDAERELLELGDKAQGHLPSIDERGLSAEQRRRLRRLLPKLWRASLAQQVAGRRVTLPGQPLRMLDALNRVAQQAGIVINDLRPDRMQEPTDPQIEVEVKDASFWQSLDQIAGEAGIAYDYNSVDRSIGLTAGPADRRPTCYTGAFRFSVEQITLQHDFATRPGQPQSRCLVQLDVQAEPTLKPVLVEVEAAACVVVDDRGRALETTGPGSYALAVESSTYQFQFAVRTHAPERDANKIAQLAGELSVWLPGHVEELVFEDLDAREPVLRQCPGLRVELYGLRDEDGVWTVPLIVEQLIEANTDSHIQAALENELSLVRKSDGERFGQNGGLSTFEPAPGKVGIEYYFVDLPGKLDDYRLVVRVPTGITRMPIQFELRDLPLP